MTTSCLTKGREAVIFSALVVAMVWGLLEIFGPAKKHRNWNTCHQWLYPLSLLAMATWFACSASQFTSLYEGGVLRNLLQDSLVATQFALVLIACGLVIDDGALRRLGGSPDDLWGFLTCSNRTRWMLSLIVGGIFTNGLAFSDSLASTARAQTLVDQARNNLAATVEPGSKKAAADHLMNMERLLNEVKLARPGWLKLNGFTFLPFVAGILYLLISHRSKSNWPDRVFENSIGGISMGLCIIYAILVAKKLKYW